MDLCENCRRKREAAQELDYDEAEALREAYRVVEHYDEIFSDRSWENMEAILEEADLSRFG